MSGGEPLAGGAGRPVKQPQEGGASVGKGRKLGHVADAVGQGQDGGAPPKQVRKPLGGIKARRVVVEGEEDPRAAPQGGGDPLHALGAQGGAGGQAPPGKD